MTVGAIGETAVPGRKEPKRHDAGGARIPRWRAGKSTSRRSGYPRAAARACAIAGARGRARLQGNEALPEHVPFLRNRDARKIHSLAHVLVGEPVSTSPEHALELHADAAKLLPLDQAVLP